MRITIYRRYNEYISLDFGPPGLTKYMISYIMKI